MQGQSVEITTNVDFSVNDGERTNSDLTNNEDAIKITTEIKHKLIFLILFIPAMVISIYLLRNSPSAKYKMMASAASWIFIIFYSNWIYLILKANKLHRIEVITGKLKPDYGNIIFPISIKQYPYKPIFSMSELFAIRGSSVHLLFMIMCISIGAIVSVAIVIHWIDQHQNHQNGVDLSEEYWQFLGINSALATPIIGNFDLNPHSKCHQFMHYLGVLMMALSVLPYGIQQGWSVISILLIISGVGVLCVWVGFSYYVPTDMSGDVKKDGDRHEIIESREEVLRYVHKISLVSILLETTGCIINSFINCAFLWNLKDVDHSLYENDVSF